MPDPDSNWQDYSPKLYVERAQAQIEMDEWANAPNLDRPVLSIESPAGTGKTWLMRDAHERWRQKHPTRLMRWMDVPAFVNLRENDIISRMLNHERLTEWLGETRTLAHRICPDIAGAEDIDQVVAASNTISRLVEDFSRRCKHLPPPIVFFDGYDELSESQAVFFSESILKHFTTRDCVRLLIGRREERSLQGWTLRNKQRILSLKGKDPVIVDDQMVKYPAGFTSYALDKLKAELPDYKWNHPFINAFLINRANLNSRASAHLVRSPEDLKKCCIDLMTRPTNGRLKYSPPSDEQFNLLQSLAKLGPKWTDIELRARQDLGVSISSPIVNSLFEYGVLTREDVFYQVADGLREILCSF